MSLENIIEKVLSLSYFKDQPPVLVDIGASGQIHAEWQLIAKHSICVAFDADDRDFKNSEENSGYKKLHLMNAIVSDKNTPVTKFYLTKSPHCSSSLPPINNELENWSFAELFIVDKEIELKNVSLASVLSELNLTHVDWYKTDSQGIDLRLFKNLSDTVQKNVIVAEFEPGFIDAYEGEDKISGLLPYMEQLPFWISDCIVKGSQRINADIIKKYKLSNDKLNQRNSACWAEFTYINNCTQFNNQRELFLAIIFSSIKKQFGFALEVLNILENKIESSLFKLIESYLLNELNLIQAETDKGILAKIKRAIK